MVESLAAGLIAFIGCAAGYFYGYRLGLDRGLAWGLDQVRERAARDVAEARLKWEGGGVIEPVIVRSPFAPPQMMALPRKISLKPGAVNYLLQVYRWHWRARLPERHGQLLVVLVRGKMNSCMVEFLSDGFRAITSRNALRRANPR